MWWVRKLDSAKDKVYIETFFVTTLREFYHAKVMKTKGKNKIDSSHWCTLWCLWDQWWRGQSGTSLSLLPGPQQLIWGPSFSSHWTQWQKHMMNRSCHQSVWRETTVLYSAQHTYVSYCFPYNIWTLIYSVTVYPITVRTDNNLNNKINLKD